MNQNEDGMDIIKTIFIWVILFSPLTVIQAETLHLLTENYPPFNMAVEQKDGQNEITGISTEIAKELFKRAKINYTIKLLSWKTAFKLAQIRPNYGIYSTTRTESRENLFRWVGPLVQNNWVFLAKRERKIRIDQIEDAKTYKIGGYEADAIALYLERMGFKIQKANRDQLNARKLELGRIDLWATGDRSGPYLAKQGGITGLEEVFVFKKAVMSIAFNKMVPVATIDRLNEILKQMRDDGAIKNIHMKYQ